MNNSQSIFWIISCIITVSVGLISCKKQTPTYLLTQRQSSIVYFGIDGFYPRSEGLGNERPGQTAEESTKKTG